MLISEMPHIVCAVRHVAASFAFHWLMSGLCHCQKSPSEMLQAKWCPGSRSPFLIDDLVVQVLALVAMENPVSLGADDIRDEKVKVLRCIAPVKADDTVLGQYISNGKDPGYLDDETTPKGSKTPTFAAIKLQIRNDRYAICTGMGWGEEPPLLPTTLEPEMTGAVQEGPLLQSALLGS